MLTKIALSAALVVVGTAPAALAASKHVRHEQTPAQARVVAPGYSDYGYSGYSDHSYPRRGEETYIGIQDQFFRESNGW